MDPSVGPVPGIGHARCELKQAGETAVIHGQVREILPVYSRTRGWVGRHPLIFPGNSYTLFRRRGDTQGDTDGLRLATVQSQFLDDIGLEARLGHFQPVESWIEALQRIASVVLRARGPLRAVRLIGDQNLRIHDDRAARVRDRNPHGTGLLSKTWDRSKK